MSTQKYNHKTNSDINKDLKLNPVACSTQKFVPETETSPGKSIPLEIDNQDEIDFVEKTPDSFVKSFKKSPIMRRKTSKLTSSNPSKTRYNPKFFDDDFNLCKKSPNKRPSLESPSLLKANLNIGNEGENLKQNANFDKFNPGINELSSPVRKKQKKNAQDQPKLKQTTISSLYKLNDDSKSENAGEVEDDLSCSPLTRSQAKKLGKNHNSSILSEVEWQEKEMSCRKLMDDFDL